MYTIDITRNTLSGTLRYSNLSIDCKCWWDLQVKIPAGPYHNCSATTMTHKKSSKGSAREAIYFSSVAGHTQIFIHMGTGPIWSDGCIVIEEKYLLQIYNDINPKNGKNVTINIRDI